MNLGDNNARGSKTSQQCQWLWVSAWWAVLICFLTGVRTHTPHGAVHVLLVIFLTVRMKGLLADEETQALRVGAGGLFLQDPTACLTHHESWLTCDGGLRGGHGGLHYFQTFQQIKKCSR